MPEYEKHKYLDELNARPQMLWFLENNKNQTFEKERQEYGFDSRETWDLRAVFYCWLYERLRMYVDFAQKVINLSYHEFVFKDKQYTQLEMIELILERIRFFFSEKFDEYNKAHIEKISEIEELWAMILPVMWW